VLVALALALRVGAVLADDGYVPLNDSADYDRHARSIASDFSYPAPVVTIAPSGGPSAFRPPGYPLALGGAYAVSGDSVDAGRLLNAALGAVAVLLLFLVARRLFSDRVALVAAGIAAVYPPLVMLSLELYSEPLFIDLMLGAVLTALRFRDDPRLRWALATGALAGMATLTRPNGVVLVLILGVWALWLPPRRRVAALAAPVAAVLAAILVIAPWTIRNQIVFNEFVPLTTGTGFNLAGVYNEDAREDERFNALWRLPIRTDAHRDLYEIFGLREVELDRELRERGREHALDHPGYVAEVTFWSALRTLNLADAGTATPEGIYADRGIGVEISVAEPIAFYVFLLLALAGGAALLRRPPGQRGPPWLWALMVALVAFTLPIIGLPRYRAPAEPFLLILAALGALAIWDWLTSRRTSD
jgi:4-amino-4-deoxy-L-arabinose transferase-like glycosyltransferase